MAKGLKSISAKNELSYYTNERNMPTKELVRETIWYFEKTNGANVFKPLEFLNLLNKQYQFVVNNKKNSQNVFSHLKALPLNEFEKHILFGFLLKWFGGYPVNNLDEDYDATLKLIEREFLTYPGNTDEKDFCKSNMERHKKFMRLSISANTKIAHGLDVYDVLDQPNAKEKVYYTFEQLFSDAAQNGALRIFEDQQSYLIEQSRYNFQFNVWLQEMKGWDYGNRNQYETFLTKDFFIEFLKYQKPHEDERQKKKEDGKKSWQVKPPQQPETKEPINEINTFCNSMPLSIPKEHFKIFTETKSKNHKPFLTDIQLNIFIQKAFCGKDNPKQRFNQAPRGEKLLIQTVFYEFYNNYCFEYFNTMQCQEIFIKLLTDNFEGWDFKNVKENFTPKTKKRL